MPAEKYNIQKEKKKGRKKEEMEHGPESVTTIHVMCMV